MAVTSTNTTNSAGNASVSMQNQSKRQSSPESGTDSMSVQNPVENTSAMVRQSIFIRKQMPDPRPSGVGSTRILQRQIIHSRSATVKRSIFIREQTPEPLPSKIGSVRVFPVSKFSRNSATVKRDIFILKQYPDPRPSKIGEEDMPGGFRKEAVMNGRKNPTYDLVHGIVQIDDIKVFFDARV